MKHFFVRHNKILSELTVNDVRYAQQVARHTLEELADDLGNGGDITTTSLFGSVSQDRFFCANVVSREDGIVAGVEEAEWFLEKLSEKNFFVFLKRDSSPLEKLGAQNDSVFQQVDPRAFHGFSWEFFVKDGADIQKNMQILKITGDVCLILAMERTLLNLLQRMSGIATATHRMVAMARKVSPNIQIAATRKTLWGLLDKKAVAIGGGWTHRLGLYDAILVKDTHRELLKNDFEAMLRNIKKAPRLGRFVEIEVESLEEAEKCARIFQKYRLKIPVLLMLDNMEPAKIRETISAVKKIAPTLVFEASGGINEKNVAEYAETGADILSLGSLTHSARGMDMSLEIRAS